MASGKVYTISKGHHNVNLNKVLITSALSGVKLDVEVLEGDKSFSELMEEKELHNKFRLVRTLAYEGKDGVCLCDTNAILFAVSNDNTNCKNDYKTFLRVHEFLTIASNELHFIVCALCYPGLGLIRPQSSEMATATQSLGEILSFLQHVLSNNSHLVGGKITVADVAVYCELLLLFEMFMDEGWRKKYPKVIEWFNRCSSEASFKSVVETVKPCEKPVEFNNELFMKLNQGKFQKKGEKAEKSEKKKGKEGKKEEANHKAESAPLDIPLPKPKVCPFSALEPTQFNLEEWKRVYSNKDKEKEAMPWFWSNLDRKGFSLWHGVYRYSSELSILFMINNLITGMFFRIEGLRKFAFGVVHITGTGERGEGNFEVSCVWLFRGQELAFDLDPDFDRDSKLYDFTKLDLENEADKKLVHDYFCLAPKIRKFPLLESHVFK